MKNYRTSEQLVGAIEEKFGGFDIYIENNPDHFRGGYEWSVSKDDEMLDTGLAFDVDSAINEAQESINNLNKNALGINPYP